jgi:pimeloyl-ACP methyl ester carboxylesterase
MVSPLRGQLGRATRMRFQTAENEGELALSLSLQGGRTSVPLDGTASFEPARDSIASRRSFASFPSTRADESADDQPLRITTPAVSVPASPHKPLPAASSAESEAEEGGGAAQQPQEGQASPPLLPQPVFSTRQALAHVVGHSADGLPVHLTLHPRQDKYWSYDVSDHSLDLMAFIKTIRLIKTAESSLRRRLRGEEEPETEEQKRPTADDCSLIGIGHSMGCAILTNYVLLSRALRRPHWLTKLILLSPAGLHKHLPFGTKPLLRAIYKFGLLGAERPFPMRSSFLQRLGSKILQDLKGLQGTGDLMAVIGSFLFGGERRNFVFRYVSVTDYPIGGTSQRVIRHGIQAIIARDFNAYDYGKKENIERYGSPRPPTFREDYGLLFGLPIHLVAGGKDILVPKANITETHCLINLILGDDHASAATSNGAGSETDRSVGSTGSTSARSKKAHTPPCTLTEFPSAGHLDLTLTTDDEIISHVLQEIDYTAASDPSDSSAEAGEPSAVSSLPSLSGHPASPRHSADGVGTSYNGPDDILGLAAFAKRRLKEYLQDAFPDGLSSAPAAAASSAGSDSARTAVPATTNVSNLGGRWIPAREAAKRHRWIMGLTNAEIVLEALDAEAVELGLVSAEERTRVMRRLRRRERERRSRRDYETSD